ncbi:hypothetical protein [Leptospira ilyithenensis]|uniref:DUF91 domain-containing protein n=1 Tax=Leptospira ilyithenensis TaxID=2484901 RepID=A0A4V3JX04_9LEPT|nr:hypothetical protein [Leptospira ilyithenensis]TGN09654.1 hypothetical protein EHS11_11205 [Leptospira ilyithenensis]
MNDINHNYWAKIILKYLVNRLEHFKGGNKYITYSELAQNIKYPEPLIGDAFGRNIGITLGEMGHFFDDLKIEGWNERIPFIQALVVSKTENLPGVGLREFYEAYPNMTKEKKLDYVQQEYKKIFQFGEKWKKILTLLRIKEESSESFSDIKNNFYNPYGSEGSPEHQALCEYVKNNPSLVFLSTDLIGIREYPLKSGDKIDVVFEDNEMLTAIEVKSIRSGEDDLERGLYQCIKYHSSLIAETKVNAINKKVKCYLVIQGKLSNKLKKVNEILKINILENVLPK